MARGGELDKTRMQRKHDQARRAYVAEITKMQDAIDKKMDKLDEINDMGPDTTVDLNPLKDFNAESWAREDTQLTQELVAAKLKLDAVKERFEFHFEEEAPAPAEVVKKAAK